jgi:protein gp37
MADLFGEWVEQAWIDQVLDAVRQAPQWNFIFLTKNPSRLVHIDWPANSWVGTTVDRQSRVEPAIEAFQRFEAPVKFVSCEPLLEFVKFPTLKCFDWLIIGAQSASGAEPEFQPESAWVKELILEAFVAHIPLYCKPNLRAGIRDYPRLLVPDQRECSPTSEEDQTSPTGQEE